MVGHRNCAVISCPNSGAKLRKWSEEVCVQHGCKRGSEGCNCETPFKLFPFPTKLQNVEKRERWLKLVNRQGAKAKKWDPDRNARVCSLHFLDGCPTPENPDPTLHLGYQLSAPTTKKRKPRDRTSNPIPVPKKLKVSKDSSVPIPPQPEVEVEEKDDSSNISATLQDHDYTNFAFYKQELRDHGCTNDTCRKNFDTSQNYIESLHHQIQELKDTVTEWKKKYFNKVAKPFGVKNLTSDKKMKTFTGIPNIATFEHLFKLIERQAPRIKYWQGSKTILKGRKFTSTPTKSGPSRKLSSKDEFLLTLMKLKLGSLNADLADRFGISIALTCNITNTWIRFLAQEWKCLINNPDKGIALQHLPQRFKTAKYNKVRHIIDCTEVFIETPSDPKLKAATWSDYKHHQTIKYLLSIMPCGTFNFVSEGWGGRTSDVAITRESGFYDILEYGDVVMADKGFTIAEDLLVRHCQLYIPPGKRGQEQMSKAEVNKTKEIANLRIFVEQAIRRLKTFRIIKHEVPIVLVDKIDDIVTICAALCNLYPKLVN